ALRPAQREGVGSRREDFAGRAALRGNDPDGAADIFAVPVEGDLFAVVRQRRRKRPTELLQRAEQRRSLVAGEVDAPKIAMGGGLSEQQLVAEPDHGGAAHGLLAVVDVERRLALGRGDANSIDLAAPAAEDDPLTAGRPCRAARVFALRDAMALAGGEIGDHE